MFDELSEIVIIAVLGLVLLVSLFVFLCVGHNMRKKLLRATQNNENPEAQIRLLDMRKEAHEKDMSEERRKHKIELDSKTAEVREIEKGINEAQRKHEQELEDMKTKHKKDIEQMIKDQKPDNEALASQSIADKFNAVQISKKGVAVAENVLNGLKATHWKESMKTSVDSGIRIEGLEKYGEILVNNLNITDIDHKKQVLICLNKVNYSKTAKNTLKEVKFEVDKFTSLYGFLGHFTAEDETVTVAYSFHSLNFIVILEEGARGITPATLTAIKETYARHMALKTLKEEGVIREISYCD